MRLCHWSLVLAEEIISKGSGMSPAATPLPVFSCLGLADAQVEAQPSFKLAQDKLLIGLPLVFQDLMACIWAVVAQWLTHWTID